jgi:hypothetical protein
VNWLNLLTKPPRRRRVHKLFTFIPIDICVDMWYNSIKERRDVQMTEKDMVIEMLKNNIERIEKDIESLKVTLENKQEELENYYNVLNFLKERG